MYNPKPQTRLEIMWAAMAGRDFDLDEKGRFEMFMSDVAERINSNGGGGVAFIVSFTKDGSNYNADKTDEEIITAINNNKTIVADIPADGARYVFMNIQLDENEIVECESIIAVDYNETTKVYSLLKFAYHDTGVWRYKTSPVSPVISQDLNDPSTDTILSTMALYPMFGEFVYSNANLRTLVETAKTDWITLASSNAGKVCVAGVVATSAQQRRAIGELAALVASNYGLFEVFSNGRFNRLLYRYGQNEFAFSDVIQNDLIPCEITVRFINDITDGWTVQVIGALPIDA